MSNSVTGSAGRFGARYGRVARRRVAEIEGEMNADHSCPSCGEDRVDRQGTGIWQCGACGHKFAGGSYQPETPGGRTVRRSLRAALGDEE
ncbi:50S ribosomal protein L37ae [Halobacteriales archaeon SW_8_65_20]|nr:MAG: 50S ribosomal protein L37ae [Halobacteriales archaeon QH_7_65_31]PSQ30877.1 MAG: 50S ribosomal protein L37ae [Halobacteriales archaeon SW_6_65_46]PSQ51184.1 MAG: 50S ribosomal protein L37ae [Halobacteriales archaeon SW_8_65_20]